MDSDITVAGQSRLAGEVKKDGALAKHEGEIQVWLRNQWLGWNGWSLKAAGQYSRDGGG